MRRAQPELRRIARLADFTVTVRCVEPPAAHPDWKDKEWARSDDPAMLISHNQSYWPDDFEALKARLASAASRIARKIAANEGGVWIGRLRDSSNDPRTDRVLPVKERMAMDVHIRNGPRGPGKAFLDDRKSKPGASKLAAIADKLRAVPPVEERRTVASREMVDRLRNYQPAEDPRPNDADLWDMRDDLPDQFVDANKMVREPGSEG